MLTEMASLVSTHRYRTSPHFVPSDTTRPVTMESPIEGIATARSMTCSTS
jgi:hypothetical protein